MAEGQETQHESVDTRPFGDVAVAHPRAPFAEYNTPFDGTFFLRCCCCILVLVFLDFGVILLWLLRHSFPRSFPVADRQIPNNVENVVLRDELIFTGVPHARRNLANERAKETAIYPAATQESRSRFVAVVLIDASLSSLGCNCFFALNSKSPATTPWERG